LGAKLKKRMTFSHRYGNVILAVSHNVKVIPYPMLNTAALAYLSTLNSTTFFITEPLLLTSIDKLVCPNPFTSYLDIILCRIIRP